MFLYLLIFILLFAAELAYFKLADHFNIIDKPNQRSSHTQITLRGGGVIFYIGALLYFVVSGFEYSWFFLGLSMIALVSFADDISPQSSKLRLVVHFVAMGLMFYQWGLFAEQWYFTLIALVVCTGIINAYNFMDGINGITGLYSTAVLAALWFINTYSVAFVDNDLIYIVLMALLVFNFFNYRKKAKCFAGDVGAVSIAFIILFLLGMLIVKTGDFSYIILLAVYGVDAVLTIIHRIILKENIFEPHRKHVYQLLANELKISHLLVSAIYMMLQCVIMVGFFVFEINSALYLALVILILSVIYVIIKMKYFKLHIIR